MDQPPTSIRALREKQLFEITWPGQPAVQLSFRFLRGRCCCAGCVDENTGQRIVDVEDISEEIAPAGLAYSGNYALKVSWSDGHDSGLYTWVYLHKLCQQAPDNG